MSYAEFIGQPTWKNSLARSLWGKNRIKSAALKNSNNHGWKHGLSLGFDYTIENSPCSYFNADLDSLLKKWNNVIPVSYALTLIIYIE